MYFNNEQLAINCDLTSANARIERATRVVDQHMALPAPNGFWFDAQDPRSSLRPYTIDSGTLLIPVQGCLMPDFPWQIGCWATGYTYISQALTRGLSDPDVQRIALIVDSPGGTVKGCFSLVDQIFASRGQKPITAFVADSAYSAAYAVASACDSIIVNRTGGCGSIGVITTHIDVSGALNEAGIAVTYIFEGDHKADGNGSSPLTAEVRARIQASLKPSYDLFTQSVARNRKMNIDDVIATQALTYVASDSVSLGLADSVADTSLSLIDYNNDIPPEDGDEDDEEDIDMTVDVNEISASARMEERKRISDILGADVSKDRGKIASHIAFKTDMTVEQAVDLIGASAVEAVPVATATKIEPQSNAFADAMNASGGAGIASDVSAVEQKPAMNVNKEMSKDDIRKMFALSK